MKLKILGKLFLDKNSALIFITKENKETYTGIRYFQSQQEKVELKYYDILDMEDISGKKSYED